MANTFYAHNSNAGGVQYKIDGTTLAVTDLPALSGASDFGLAVSPDGSTLIAAHGASNTIATLDLANPTAWVDTATDMSAFSTPELLYQPSGRIIIVDRYTGIWYIPAGTWPDSPTLLTNVVPGASNVLQAVLSPDGTKVYCAYTNQYGSGPYSIYVFDTTTGDLITSYVMAPGSYPSTPGQQHWPLISISVDGTLIAVTDANYTPNTIWIINSADGSLVVELTVATKVNHTQWGATNSDLFACTDAWGIIKVNTTTGATLATVAGTTFGSLIYQPALTPAAASAPTEYGATTSSITINGVALTSGATSMYLLRVPHGTAFPHDGTDRIAGPYTVPTNATNGGLTDAAEYDYQWEMVNAAGSSFSPTASFWTIPTAPSGLSAAWNGGAPVLSWPSQAGAATYSVYRYATGVGATEIASGVTGLTYTDNALPDTTHQWNYYVTAWNADGLESAGSNVVSFYALPPQTSAVLSANVTKSQTSLAVNMPNLANAATGTLTYNAYGSPDGETDWVAFATGAAEGALEAIVGLAPGTTRYLRIDAVNATGTTAGLVSAAIKTLTPPPTYVSSQTSTDGQHIDVTLAATYPPILPSSGVTGFMVKVNGIARTILGAATISDTVIRLVLITPVRAGDFVTVEYADGNVTDSAD